MANNFASAIKTALAGIGVGISIAGIGDAIKQVAEYGAEIGRAAARTGMTTAQISGLRFAAEAAGVSFETLQRSLGIFDKNVAGLSSTTSKAGQALAALGVQTKDAHGKILPAHELLLRTAEAFSKMDNSATKTALAIALFGKSGASLIPFLNEGRTGIETLERQAGDLGLIMGKNAATACEEFEASMVALNGAIKGTEIAIGMTAIPAITDFIVSLVALWESGESATQMLKDFCIGIGFLISLGPALLTDVLTFSKKGTDALIDWATKAALAVKPADDLTKKILDLKKALQFLGSGGGTFAPPEIPGKEKTTKEPAELKVAGLDAYTKSIEQFIKEMERADAAPPSLARRIEMLNDAFHKGMIGIEEYNRLLKETREAAINAVPELKPPPLPPMPDFMKEQLPSYSRVHTAMMDLANSMNGLSAKGQQFGQTMIDSFNKMVIQGKNWQSELRGMITLLVEAIAKAMILHFVGGQTWGQAFGISNKQTGGPVSEGQLYMVGESGPELFAPGMSGSIIPNGALSAGRGDVNIDARGADAGVEHKIMRAWAASQATQRGQGLAATYDAHRRGIPI